MPAEVKEQIRLEVAHVLFIDTVGYSKLSINEQRTVVEELTNNRPRVRINTRKPKLRVD